MICVMSDLSEKLKELKIAKKTNNLINDMLINQLYIHKKLKYDISNLFFILVGTKDGVELIRVFEQKDIFLESLETSCLKYQKMLELSEKEIKFLFWISFIDNGKYINIEKCKLSDLNNMKLKKVKNLSYAISDGEDVIKIDILQADVKGVTTETLKNISKYVFEKQTKKKNKILNLAIVAYEY